MLKYRPSVLVEYLPRNKTHSDCEWFKVTLTVADRIEEKTLRYRWYKGVLFIQDDNGILESERYTSWSDIKKEIQETFGSWQDLILVSTHGNEDNISVTFSGYRPCYESEIKTYDALQEQVDKVKQNIKKAAAEKIEEAKQKHDLLVMRYQQTYGELP